MQTDIFHELQLIAVGSLSETRFNVIMTEIFAVQSEIFMAKNLSSINKRAFQEVYESLNTLFN